MESISTEFIVIKLKSGWAFDAASGTIKRQGRAVSPELPQGMELVPALPLARPKRGRPTPAERELERFVHLRLPDAAAAAAALALVRSWPFVERVDGPFNPAP